MSSEPAASYPDQGAPQPTPVNNNNEDNADNNNNEDDNINNNDNNDNNVRQPPTVMHHLLTQSHQSYDSTSHDPNRYADAMSSHSSFMSEIHDLDDVEYNQRRVQRRARQKMRKTYYKIHGGAARDKARKGPPSLKDRIFKFVPILRWSRVYSMEQFKGDLVAGVTVGAMVIPQV